MMKGMQVVLVAMLAVSIAALTQAGLEQGLLILVLFAFSSRAYFLVRDLSENEDREGYEKQMKIVQTFTVACALLSFYWPESMYFNAGLAICLLFHIMATQQAKKMAKNYIG